MKMGLMTGEDGLVVRGLSKQMGKLVARTVEKYQQT